MYKPVGIAVPDYSRHFGIPGPYFGDKVLEHLDKNHPRKFVKIPITVKRAADSSEETLTEVNVRERDVYLVHPTYVSAARHVQIACEIADDLLRSDARRVVLFDPYNRYFSYDKRKRKQSLNARLVADEYATAGFRRVFTFDPHSEELGLAFSRLCPLEGLSLHWDLAEHYRNGYRLDGTTICAPDAGGVARADIMANLLGLPMISLIKRRDVEASDKVKVVGVMGETKDYKGKRIVIRDDVLRTAGSLEEASVFLKDRGAKEVWALETHVDPCGPAMERLRRHDIRVIGTNTVPRTFSEEEKKYIDIGVDVSPTVAEAIYRRSEGMSLSAFFDPGKRSNRKRR